MGIDAKYQALPDPCELLERATREPDFGEVLATTRSAFVYRGVWHGPTPETSRVDFYSTVRHMIADYPDIETRNYVTRTWDALHYVLSSERRRGVVDAHDQGTIAVRGGSPVGALCSTIGTPIRFTRADQVRELAEWIESIAPSRLREHVDTEVMRLAGIYKFRFRENTDFLWIIESYLHLASLYRDAANRGEGVLVVFD